MASAGSSCFCGGLLLTAVDVKLLVSINHMVSNTLYGSSYTTEDRCFPVCSLSIIQGVLCVLFSVNTLMKDKQGSVSVVALGIPFSSSVEECK